MITSQSIKDYNNGLERVYIHQLPKWMKFYLFMKRGIYNGKSTWRWSRIKCYFNKHLWGGFEYQSYVNGKPVRYHHQCTKCGLPSHKINY